MDNRQEAIIGMTEEQLVDVCSGGDVDELRKFPDWSSEIYGFGKLIRTYGFYPRFLPLYVSTDHGPGQHDFPNKKELSSKMPVHFYHSPRLVELWPKYSDKPCYTLYSPFVFYKDKYIKKKEPGEGTLAFPSHSTHFIDIETDINIFIDRLLSLPADYHPVSVCLYFLDVQKGLHKPFMKRGIPVYSAGHWLHPDFVENFYRITKKFRYATSDSCGSYLFYTVNLGLPFFLFGEKPEKFNHGDSNSQLGKYNNTNYAQIRKIESLFSEMKNYITEEQRKIVNKELGVYDGLSRFALSVILYKAFFQAQLVKLKKILRALMNKMANEVST